MSTHTGASLLSLIFDRYFLLWLREYTTQYRQWEKQSKSLRDTSVGCHPDWLHTSSQLAMFYARAKQTFFTPNSDYELNLPSQLLAPFHVHVGPHPDPCIFDQVAIDTRKALKDSLRRFVTAQFNNVGNNRVLCGMIAGTVFCLVGAVVPLVYNLTMGKSRWLRLTAAPGLWLGLMILLTSINGICVGVYIFGDARQLRKFELSRPPISKPQLIRASLQRPSISSPIVQSSPPVSSHSEVPHHPMIPPLMTTPVPPPPPPMYSSGRPSPRSHFSDDSDLGSLGSTSSGASSSSESIHISPVYYDTDNGPSSRIFGLPPNLLPNGHPGTRSEDDNESRTSFCATAAFIHHFEGDALVDNDGVFDPDAKMLPEELQPISSFDFDALPQPHRILAPPKKSIGDVAPPSPQVFYIEPEQQPLPPAGLSPKGFLRRMQSKCHMNKWLVFTTGETATTSPPETESELHPRSSRGTYICRLGTSIHLQCIDKLFQDALLKKQFKLIMAVPAFGSPLTPVLNPVVVRGQWEIVIRSVVIAGFLAWVILGCLLAVPVPKRYAS